MLFVIHSNGNSAICEDDVNSISLRSIMGIQLFVVFLNL